MKYDILVFFEGYAIFRMTKKSMVFVAVYTDHITAEDVCRDLNKHVTHRCHG